MDDKEIVGARFQTTNPRYFVVLTVTIVVFVVIVLHGFGWLD